MEEDIKILEELIKKYRNDNVNTLDLDSNDLFKRLIFKEEQVQLLENLIKGYKELEEIKNSKLDEYLHNDLWIYKYLAENYIPKSKIKELKEANEINIDKMRPYRHQGPFDFGVLNGIDECCRILLEDK